MWDLFEAPFSWNSIDNSIPFSVLQQVIQRNEVPVSKRYTDAIEDHRRRNFKVPWHDEIFYAKVLPALLPGLSDDPDLREDSEHFDSILKVFARILIEAMSVQRDCERPLLHLHDSHELCFFTNRRTIQVYCCHNSVQKSTFVGLQHKDIIFQLEQHNLKFNGVNYEQYTEIAFLRSRPFLVWECIFPEGIDMEALSPRDANAHIRVKQPSSKSLAPKAIKPVTKLVQKEKDHPPPPPADVFEPPSNDRRQGATYQTGKCLGKGGFAICYEGHLVGTRQKYALKIVKSHMPQKKMEQKV